MLIDQNISDQSLIDLGRAVIKTESEAVTDLLPRLDKSFADACRYMLACDGRIVVTGMGKSGHIGGKIAATLASTGSPAFFMHPAEASHGDLGMITAKDVVIAISYSGETEELLTIVPLIKRQNVPLIVMSGKPQSTLVRHASAFIDISIKNEACPLGLAPTSSTTATLVMGDAMAVALLESRGFTEEDFAYSHPGGALGRKLLLRVDELMHAGKDMPFVPETASVGEALSEMTRSQLGFTNVVNLRLQLVGIFTDGDLRRMLANPLDSQKNIHGIPVTDVMTKNCTAIKFNVLAAEALHVMESRKINAVPVVDDNNVLVGALNMHDLLRAGVM
ncbi:MAG: KpsF/GutQ family sugar-phosphate isomerase [Gammaproteobacteria bacterium]|nr:KpsF/GutQ family sugar-phosphate isomerase [Gammaproteobacteria bacterium]